MRKVANKEMEETSERVVREARERQCDANISKDGRDRTDIVSKLSYNTLTPVRVDTCEGEVY